MAQRVMKSNSANGFGRSAEESIRVFLVKRPVTVSMMTEPRQKKLF